MCGIKARNFLGKYKGNRLSRHNLMVLLTYFLIAISFCGLSFEVSMRSPGSAKIVAFTGAINSKIAVILTAFFLPF